MKKRWRKLYSQNLLTNPALIKRLVKQAAITGKDLVLEIGPGTGNITEQLLQKAKQVIAVEIDPRMVTVCQTRFKSAPHLTLIRQDFLNYELPQQSYKVFANIPFAIEGKIIRKLLNTANPPTDCFISIRKELAYRLAGVPRNNQFAMIHKPFFEFFIVHEFRSQDFQPRTQVDVAFLRVKKQPLPLIPWKQRTEYRTFIRLAFNNGRPIFNNLKQSYPRQKLKQAFTALKIPISSKPSHISLNQWLQLYCLLSQPVDHVAQRGSSGLA